jgi:hypothetical protein
MRIHRLNCLKLCYLSTKALSDERGLKEIHKFAQGRFACKQGLGFCSVKESKKQIKAKLVEPNRAQILAVARACQFGGVLPYYP